MDKKHTPPRLEVPQRINLRLTPLIHADLQWLADHNVEATDLTDLLRRIIRAQRLALDDKIMISLVKHETSARSKRKA